VLRRLGWDLEQVCGNGVDRALGRLSDGCPLLSVKPLAPPQLFFLDSHVTLALRMVWKEAEWTRRIECVSSRNSQE
jgi:hypothetical protein